MINEKRKSDHSICLFSTNQYLSLYLLNTHLIKTCHLPLHGCAISLFLCGSSSIVQFTLEKEMVRTGRLQCNKPQCSHSQS